MATKGDGPCARYSQAVNVPVTATDFDDRVHDDGHQCILDYYGSCESECTNPRSEKCRLCVTDKNRCPKIGADGQVAGACCPNAAQAMACADCLGRNGNDVTRCTSNANGLSTGTLIGIIVGCIGGVVLLGVIIYAAKTSYDKAQKKNKQGQSKPLSVQTRTLRPFSSLGRTMSFSTVPVQTTLRPAARMVPVIMSSAVPLGYNVQPSIPTMPMPTMPMPSANPMPYTS